ncbi:hypothetical protein F5887DRAFT_1088454 [Amanita rubescens]|nr:hypothetical protein F5887DRAFT_1088454 [Amanita rubescens]
MSKSSIRSRLRPDRAHLGIRARLLPALTVLAVEINVLATGRVNSQIRNEFQGHGKVIIGRDDINHDARRFVETDVRHVKTRDPQLVRDIIDRLISGAQGTFLWPSYHMRRLRKLRTDYDIREALDDLPHGMEDTLSRALETIDAHPNSDRIRRVLRLAIYAVQPLTLYELAEGIATGEMIDVWDPARVVTDPISLIDDCANLLVCAPSSTFPYLPDVVIPFHASVKEFLANPARITQPFLRYALYPQSVVHCDLAYEELGALQLYDKNGVKLKRPLHIAEYQPKDGSELGSYHSPVLVAGANPHFQNDEGQSALHLLMNNPMPSIVMLYPSCYVQFGGAKKTSTRHPAIPNHAIHNGYSPPPRPTPSSSSTPIQDGSADLKAGESKLAEEGNRMQPPIGKLKGTVKMIGGRAILWTMASVPRFLLLVY